MPTTPETTDWVREDAPSDGVVTGYGEIDGRSVALIATDFTVKGGSIGHAGGRKMSRVAERALDRGLPLLMLHDGGGHRIQEGLDAAPFARGDNGFSKLQTALSGWVPVVSAMMGPAFAAPTNFAALSDFVPIVEGTGTMGVAGPSLSRSRARRRRHQGGTRQRAVSDDRDRDGRPRLRGRRGLPRRDPDVPLVPAAKRSPGAADGRLATAGRRRRAVARDHPLEPTKGVRHRRDRRGDRRPGLGVRTEADLRAEHRYRLRSPRGGADRRHRQQPRIKAGTIDTGASEKAAHFAAICDAYGLPVLTLADVPGILPGPDSEREGIARHSAKLPFELARATVPIANVVLRRGYGFGYVAMGGGRSIDSELTVLWPTAEVAAMGIEGAVDIAYRREIESADDSEARRAELIEKFKDRTDAVRAASRVGTDGVVQPEDTRDRVLRAFARADEPHEDDWPPKKRPINPI